MTQCDTVRSLEDELMLGTSEDDVLLSPLLAPRPLLAHFPPTLLLSTDMDACLDECVQFRANLEAAGVRTRMEIVRGETSYLLIFSDTMYVFLYRSSSWFPRLLQDV